MEWQSINSFYPYYDHNEFVKEIIDKMEEVGIRLECRKDSTDIDENEKAIKRALLKLRTQEEKMQELDAKISNLKSQKEIIAFLDNKCSNIKEIINSKKQELTNLNQYKQSIIYEYVTGKKQVSSEEGVQE